MIEIDEQPDEAVAYVRETFFGELKLILGLVSFFYEVREPLLELFMKSPVAGTRVRPRAPRCALISFNFENICHDSTSFLLGRCLESEGVPRP